MTNPAIQGVIFDLGATLIENDQDYASIFSQSLVAIADYLDEVVEDLDREAFIDRFGQALLAYHRRRNDDHIEHSTYTILCEVLEPLLKNLPEESRLRQGLAVMYAESETFWKPKPGMHAVLERLAASSYRLGLLSNAGDEANVQRLIDQVDIRAYFDPILISAALGIRKPDPRPFQQISDYWDLPAEAVVMVGDLLEADVLGARRAGMHSIWLRNETSPVKEVGPEDPQPDLIATDLSQVPDLILRLDQKG